MLELHPIYYKRLSTQKPDNVKCMSLRYTNLYRYLWASSSCLFTHKMGRKNEKTSYLEGLNSIDLTDSDGQSSSQVLNLKTILSECLIFLRNSINIWIHAIWLLNSIFRVIDMKRFAYLFFVTAALFSAFELRANNLIWSGQVSAKGSQTQKIWLTAGETYVIEVSGSVQFGTWRNGKRLINDACYEFNAKGYADPLPVLQNSLGIPLCDGTYRPSHVYRSQPFKANGSSLFFWIFDTDYRDNSGSMSVRIVQMDNRPSGLVGTSEHLVTKAVDTGHQVQCWKLDPGLQKSGRWKLSMPHAASGRVGGFYLVAWTDSDGDGKPDRLIGSSELKVANQKGEWSSWVFSAPGTSVFIGNAWPQTNEKVFYQMGGAAPSGYSGLGSTVFYSRNFNGVPNQTAAPRYTNIRLEFLGN